MDFNSITRTALVIDEGVLSRWRAPGHLKGLMQTTTLRGCTCADRMCPLTEHGLLLADDANHRTHNSRRTR